MPFALTAQHAILSVHPFVKPIRLGLEFIARAQRGRGGDERLRKVRAQPGLAVPRRGGFGALRAVGSLGGLVELFHPGFAF